MVSAALYGRLGNSMFQIAASIGYARKYGYQWAVQSRPHNDESAIHRVFPNLPKTNERGVMLQEHPSKICAQHGTHYDECHFNYHELPNKGDSVFLSGFWQSWKYFEHCKDEVKKVFALPHVPGYEDYVSIHVRRGDYVQHAGSFPPVTVDYILKAMQMFLDIKPLQKFIVFSDDIQWCIENIKLSIGISGNESAEEIRGLQSLMDAMVEFSEGRNELEDLSLMASCGHHIIANSTFSWWGAYLGHNPNKIVISPSCERGQWFGLQSGIKQDAVDLLPPEWAQIKFR